MTSTTLLPAAEQTEDSTAPLIEKTAQVVVLICGFNSRAYLDDCLNSVLAADASRLDLHVVLVDDASTDGSADHVADRFSGVRCIRREPPNKGFAGANNLGWAYIREHFPDVEFLVLLNVDTIADARWLQAMVKHLRQNPTVGCVQAKLRLHPHSESLNTAGNRCHFLGFGFMVGYGETDDGQYDDVRSIDFASGAALMVRADLIERVELFDDELFMYLEDTELCWKLRQIGYDTHLVPESVVYHKYIANAPLKHYYHLERNRWILIFTYYRALTILLLAPALCFMEIGQLAYAAMKGVFRQKLESWAYFFRPRNIARIWRRRRAAQRRRTIGDRESMGRFAGVIQFEAIDHPLLTYIGNPILNLYWRVVRKLIIW